MLKPWQWQELLMARERWVWPPGLVEQSRPGVGKILFGLMTDPSSTYPRTVTRVCQGLVRIRDASVSIGSIRSAVLYMYNSISMHQLREGSLSQVSCPAQWVVTEFQLSLRETMDCFALAVFLSLLLSLLGHIAQLEREFQYHQWVTIQWPGKARVGWSMAKSFCILTLISEG